MSDDDVVKRREGMTFVCSVPNEFGAVTKLEVKRGKLIARTESGHTMILPRSRDPSQGIRSVIPA